MKELEAPERVIFVCDGSKCGKYSKEIRKALKTEIKENGLKNDIQVVKMDCTDNCDNAPVACFQPENAWFGELTTSKVIKIFEKICVIE